MYDVSYAFEEPLVEMLVVLVDVFFSFITCVLPPLVPDRIVSITKMANVSTGIASVADLLWHLPTGIVDRRQVRRVADLAEGEMATVLLKVTTSGRAGVLMYCVP